MHKHIIYNKYLRDRVRKESSLGHYNAANLLSVHALIGAYKPEGYEWVDELCQVLTENVNYAYDFIRNNFEGVELFKPEGTYMLFLDCTKWCDKHGKTLDELLHAGAEVEVMGPLGNGFFRKDKKAMLIAGGIGVPPMLELAKQLDCEKSIVLGYRDELFLDQEFAAYGDVYIASEDGKHGTKGNVMDAINENALEADIILACGPMPMLRAIKKYAEEHNITAYISLEERMACGVGACLGCVVKTKEKDHHSHVNNARICTDGPVYLASEVEI